MLAVNPPSGSTSTTNHQPSGQRQSLLSTHSTISTASTSATTPSFRTAPLTTTSHNSSAFSHISSRSSTGHTLRDSELNAVQTITATATAQEVTILRVNGDTLQIEPGPFLKPIRSRGNLEDDEDRIGPPPPSPPASETEEVEPGREPTRRSDFHQPSASSRPGPPTWHSEPTQTASTPPPTANSFSSSSAAPIAGGSNSSPHRERQRSNGSIQTSVRTIHRSPTDSAVPSSSKTPSLATLRPASESMPPKDGYLQPPPVSIHRPTRRNTTGSSARRLLGGAGAAPGQAFPLDDAELSASTMTGGELASDIELHAEQIRRERMSKRQKEAEAALTRPKKEEKQDVVLVGNLIGEDHVNFVLMYNMLTGIRIAVSRCQAKIRRELTTEDFIARHKYSFDIVGNELTPSAKYDFKFKDYAPWVFRVLREDHFHLDPADYLLSLTAKYILSELGSPGKSGSFFYFSRDYRFIIKTIHHAEHKFLLKILPRYYEHVKANPHTLLSRFYGLHRVKLPRGKKIHFVIMNNLFPPHKDIHETYDLKGSTVGREYSEEKATLNPRAVLKDLNWINRGKMLELGPEKRALITEQLRRDAELLKEINVMDYSLLVGIHNMQRGNRDKVRKNTLKVFQPDMPEPGTPGAPSVITMRRIMRSSDPKRLGKNTIKLPEADTGERQHFIFYQDEGGLRATDESNDAMNTIYYLGVIDILTPYSFRKKLEHLWKGLQDDIHKISPVPPEEYADRFFDFMKAIMRGGGGGARFKADYKPGSPTQEGFSSVHGDAQAESSGEHMQYQYQQQQQYQQHQPHQQQYHQRESSGPPLMSEIHEEPQSISTGVQYRTLS
ncbi:SAICAR synthase-like protein [Pluteus cervinus]|uniref:SAICAR synthase-like protein n=1 Tax=Pluteus cervinus TaxID=181527 RepID=A0ACD3AR00_9AGAR|nr:SAICAR synthase-like protein [Pluteus cervinus]